ncbi:protein FAM219B-like [Ctenopharyngodon idella]|uniref:protein FAM219B-like n=1 Tax=Ctenopharyngodon idella TaxID=7959 RepID=UPI00223071FF|nr:protein FAM219B-like [Ctenopharyngodon idella]XP_051726896.1 protein FAM219B-like [Ctenopharyngodon idella]
MSDTMESREQRTLLSEREPSAETKRAGLSEQPQAAGERITAVEKRGPYLMTKAHAFNSKLQKQRETARRALQKRGLSPAGPVLHQPRHKPKTVKFNKGYAALSQTGEDSLISLDSDSDAELDCSSGYSSAEIHPDLSRQLLKDGYHLDEIPDDEDLDLIPPKALSSSVCCCSEASSCCVQ